MDDTFIPTTLEEAFEYLKKLDGIDEFKSGEEDYTVSIHHHGLGRWIRNNWELWKETGPLFEQLKSRGLWHADDMSSVILRSFHRHLNNKPLKLEEQFQEYKDYWAQNGGNR